jgi:tRNA G18 (ribose-2'-O)-methylase SpoU
VADFVGLTGERARTGERLARNAGVFIGEGEFVVRQMLKSRFRTRAVLGTRERLDEMRDVLAAAATSGGHGEAAGLRNEVGVRVFAAEPELIARIAGFDFHRGVLASGERRDEESWRDLLANSARANAGALWLEDLSNHDNVGGMFRTVGALWPGACVLLSERCADPLYRKSVRTSMGMVLHVPFARTPPVEHTAAEIRAMGGTLIALTPAGDALDLGDVRLSAGTMPVLMLGAEGPGLTPAAMKAADMRVRITIDPRADSLNVVVAAAIAMHSMRSRTLER